MRRDLEMAFQGGLVSQQGGGGRCMGDTTALQDDRAVGDGQDLAGMLFHDGGGDPFLPHDSADGCGRR
jgi:hypothetical protein